MRGPWKYRLDFIARHETSYQNNEIDLHEMARRILKGFVARGWVNDTFFSKGVEPTLRVRETIGEYGHDQLEEILDQLHTIAFAKDIYGEDEKGEWPTVDTYDHFKGELYDWADEYRVWIAPASFVNQG